MSTHSACVLCPHYTPPTLPLPSHAPNTLRTTKAGSHRVSQHLETALCARWPMHRRLH